MTSLGVISFKKINHKDVLFILFRDLEIPLSISNNFSIVRLPNEIVQFDYFYVRKLHKFNWIKVKKIIKVLDGFILEHTLGSEFQFYCQNSRHYYLNMISTHYNCIETFYVEESMDAHLSEEIFNLKYSLKLKWPYKIINMFCFLFFSKSINKRLILPNSAFEKRTLDKYYFFGITKNSFLNYCPKESIKVVDLVLKPELKNSNDKTYIICLSALEEQGVLDANIAANIYKDFLEKENIKDIFYIKFHPFQSEKSKNIFKNSFKNFQFKILSDNFILEKEFVNGNNIVISIASSLLIYAKKLNVNNKVIPLYKYTKKFIDNQRYLIWENALNQYTD
jgi:hypothetical protein